jgi:hypothetical protein
MLAVVMTRPRCPSSRGSFADIAAAALLRTVNVPVRKTSIVRRKVSTGYGVPSRPTMRLPAARPPCTATVTRSGPSSVAAATAAATDSSLVTSVWT